MYSEALDTKKTLLLMNDTLRVTFESEMLAMREEHNRLVESLKERDDTIQWDLIEVDRRLNCHRRALNELDTKVGATSPGLCPRELIPLLRLTRWTTPCRYWALE
jgi:hypothetical protein